MKTVYKVVYYVTITISTFMFFLFLIAPFGGMVGMIKEGFFAKIFEEFDSVLILRVRQLQDTFHDLLHLKNLFLICALCIVLPFTKFRQQIKHKIAFVFFLILLSITLIPNIIAFLIVNEPS